MKKICKFLTFLLVLAMLLSTVAMAEDTYTITAGEFTHGTITVKYNDGEKDYQPSIKAGGTIKTALRLLFLSIPMQDMNL